MIIKLLGGWTNEEYRKMYNYLVCRFEKEYKEKLEIKEEMIKVRRIAMNIAAKYNDNESIKQLLNKEEE